MRRWIWLAKICAGLFLTLLTLEGEAAAGAGTGSGLAPESPAGYGGRVLRVTNLKDSGRGSLRAALAVRDARIVMFEVGGEIRLQSDLEIRTPFLTLAGQTAPSPGITLRGAGLRIRSHDILIQHLRIRVGAAAAGPKPGNRDAVQILGPDARRVVLDHISASWGIDELVSTWYPVEDITLQHSILSEALNRSLHPKGPHSAGLLIGPESYRINVIGNLLLHNAERNPRVHGATSLTFANNLVYNGRAQMVIGSDRGAARVSIIDNLFLRGPQTPPEATAIQLLSPVSAADEIFLQDNGGDLNLFQAPPGFKVSTRSPLKLAGRIRLRSLSELEGWILANAGARPADRDPVDRRLVDEVRKRSGRIIDAPEDVGGWPQLPTTHRQLPDFGPEPHDNDPARVEAFLNRCSRRVEHLSWWQTAFPFWNSN